ncbi:hypothetical protein RMATCC62417_10967 [Rhizopus microsporus]|nr:hypothetical protein RMATCC62417_10967 [Rhizopus microsporus]
MIRQSTVKNRVKWCVNDNNSIIDRSSLCPNKTQTGYVPIIYLLKLCRQCPAGNAYGGNLIWNRDVDAALNIRSILGDYVNSNYNIGSRDAAFRRVL